MASTDDAAALAHPNLKPYPPAADGMKRLVIVLDGAGKDNPGGGPVAGEDDMEVELIAGATIETDGANRVRLMGVGIEEGTVQGWGYSFWTVSGDPGKVASTMMMPGPDAVRENRFVSGASKKIRYNSRLPVVIYCPSNMECRYRIWKASGGDTAIAEG